MSLVRHVRLEQLKDNQFVLSTRIDSANFISRDSTRVSVIRLRSEAMMQSDDRSLAEELLGYIKLGLSFIGPKTTSRYGPGFIYVCTDGIATKIGLTYVCPLRRISVIAGNHYNPIYLTGIVLCTGDGAHLERATKFALARHKLRGEWFSAPAHVVLKTIRRELLSLS